MNIEIIAGSFMLGFSILLKDIFKNLFAGVYLFLGSEFKRGDKVKFEKWEGIISGFSLRNIHIKLDDGGLLIKESSEFLEADVIRRRKEK